MIGLVVPILAPPASAAADTAAERLIVFSDYDGTDKNADSRHASLWLTSPHGNAIRQLTHSPSSDGTPAWAPDGRTIAFVRLHETAGGIFTGYELHKVDAETGTETLVSNAGSFSWPSWSPDGQRIAVSGQLGSVGEVVGTNIFVMSSAGSDLQPLTFGNFYDTAPAWSPFGDLLAFSSNRQGDSSVWLIDADGTNQHAVPTGLLYAQAPDWSPDGQWLVVVGVLDSVSQPELYKLRPDGTELTRLTFGPNEGKEDPTWSPDGATILFQAFPGHGTHGSGEFYTVPATGGVATQLGTHHLEAQAEADWQPLTP